MSSLVGTWTSAALERIQSFRSGSASSTTAHQEQGGSVRPSEEEEAVSPATSGGADAGADSSGSLELGLGAEIALSILVHCFETLILLVYYISVHLCSLTRGQQTAIYGELAPECASTYYKYGAALLYKYQEESDPLGNVPKSAAKAESVKSTTAKNDSESSKASGSNVDDDVSSEKVDSEEGQNSNGKDQENGSNEIGNDDVDGDDENAGDEDSDLDQSWNMLDIARAIVEKCSDNTLLKVKIFSALGEVSLEREDIDTSLSDYFKALAILEELGEPDHRQVVEVNFRICLVYELACKNADAIPYCEKAISACKSRIQRLKNSKDVVSSGKDDNASAAEGGSEKALEDEIESLTGILSDLEKKLEDLKQSATTPVSKLDDIINMAAMKSAQVQKDANPMLRAASFASSQMGTTSNGFDSSTMSTAATTGSTGSTVTDLGVVGRGVKRASIKPISDEPSSKKPALDSASPQVDSSNNSEVLTAQNRDDSVSK